MLQGTGLIVFSLLVLAAILLALHRYLRSNPDSILNRSKILVYSGMVVFGLLVIFALLPINGEAKNSVFSLLGLVVTAVIAISSTTFVANAMAGTMLRIIRNFRAGDFIEVDEHFGRVSEMGLLHTEIQTKSRNLTTLPNLYLITNAVTVVPNDKALIDAELSLGYDVSHHDVERVLLSAAEKIGLSKTFVQVTQLGDFAIAYRVAGFLDDPKLLLVARSNLRKQIIDSLHGAGIEIVSPAFMNQRQYRSDEMFMSVSRAYQERQNKKAQKSDVFDKAETAEAIEHLKAQCQALSEAIKIAKAADEIQKLTEKKTMLESQIAHLTEIADRKTTVAATEVNEVDKTMAEKT